MIGFAETFGATIASFIGPAFVGLLVISLAARYLSPKYLAAFAVGIYLWFFSDTIGDASYLSVDSGFSGGIWHVLVWLVFGVGLVVMFALDMGLFTSGPENSKLGFTIPLLVAFAVGIHGFGEGAAIGATAVGAPSNDLLSAFGGLAAGVAFVLHKALEPMMVGAAYWIYAKERAVNGSAIMRDISILVTAFTIPGIIGSAVAYFLVQVYPTADFTYVFAIGLGTSIYALVRLARPMFGESIRTTSESVRMALLVLLGFTCLYLAALLHS
jgi:hypothetical protein